MSGSVSGRRQRAAALAKLGAGGFIMAKLPGNPAWYFGRLAKTMRDAAHSHRAIFYRFNVDARTWNDYTDVSNVARPATREEIDKYHELGASVRPT